MKIETAVIVDASELEVAVMEAFELKHLELRNLFWEGDYMNDCYKSLCIQEEEVTSWEYEGTVYELDGDEKADVELRNKVRKFLREVFPNAERVLVDVSW